MINSSNDQRQTKATRMVLKTEIAKAINEGFDWWHYNRKLKINAHYNVSFKAKNGMVNRVQKRYKTDKRKLINVSYFGEYEVYERLGYKLIDGNTDIFYAKTSYRDEIVDTIAAAIAEEIHNASWVSVSFGYRQNKFLTRLK